MSLLLRQGSHQFIERSLGYTFLDSDLMAEALDTSGLRSPESNQRLAMLGDALLKIVILDGWYASGTPKGESLAGRNSQTTSDLMFCTRPRQQQGFYHRQQCKPCIDGSRSWPRDTRQPAPRPYWPRVRQNPCDHGGSDSGRDLPGLGQGHGRCPPGDDAAWSHGRHRMLNGKPGKSTITQTTK